MSHNYIKGAVKKLRKYVKVAARNFQFLLSLAPPLDKRGSDAYSCKDLCSHVHCWQRIHLFWKQVKERSEDGSWRGIYILLEKIRNGKMKTLTAAELPRHVRL